MLFRSPQRRARLYRSLVDGGLASAVSGALLPTAEPFLYYVSMTANRGIALAAAEEALIRELDEVARAGVDEQEVARARTQLFARLIFDADSVTNVAHQIGYFDTIASIERLRSLPGAIGRVTAREVSDAAAALLRASNRTIGWFDPLPSPGATSSVRAGAAS